MLLRLIFCLGFLLFTCSGYSEEQVQFHSAPNWVNVIQPGEDSSQSPVDGLRYLLVDKQINLSQGRVERYFHFVLRITSTEGLEQASQLAFDYEPGYETLAIHQVNVIRQGKTLNRLEPQELRVFQREPDLEHYLYSGTKTAYLILPDIRVGDTLEYSYTLYGSNPVLGNLYSTSIQLDGDLPISRSYMRIILNPAHAVHYSVPEGNNGHLTLENGSTQKELLWQETNIPAQHTEPHVPGWFSPYRYWLFSEYDSWHDIAQWALPLFEKAAVVSPDINDLAQQMIKANSAPKARAMAALIFVQQQIRYLGIEDGIGSHTPRSAAETLYRRYGDCKDKTILLVALLKAMGFSPKVALVSLEQGNLLPKLLPAPNVFDHVIVQLQLDNKTYWLDGTNLDQGTDLDSISVPDLHYALLLEPETQSLTAIQDNNQASGVSVYRELWLREPYSQLAVDAKFTGVAAETKRAELKSLSAEMLENQLLGYYSKLYFNSEHNNKPQILDDLKTNQLELKQRFELSDSLDDLVKNGLPLYADLIDQQLKNIDSNRTQPLSIGKPVHIQQEFVFHLPYAIEIADYHQQYDHELFSFSVSVHQYSPTLLRVIYHYQSKTDYIPVSELARYREFVQLAREDMALNFSIPPLPDDAQNSDPQPSESGN